MDITPFLILFFLFTVVYSICAVTVSLHINRRGKIERDYTMEPTVTVMMSAFNEGDAVYRTVKSIYESNYPAEKIQVIVFDDCSKDDTWDWIEKAARDYPGCYIERNKFNQGKADTLADAAPHATGEILISTDSDCIFDPDAIKELAVCFVEPKVGAVGGHIGIYNANQSLLTQCQTILYSMDFNLFKPMESALRSVQCLGGPLVAFRRSLYQTIMPKVRQYNFLGERVTIGEDRVITQQVLLNGYATLVTNKAKCWVGTPVTWSTYFKQQLRWRRSAVGQWVYTLFHLATFIRSAGFISTMGSLFPLIANFVWIIYVIYTILIGNFAAFMITFLVIKAFLIPLFGVVYNYYVGRFDTYQKIENPMLSSVVMAIWFTVSITLVMPWAICTLDDGGWITRQNGAKGNS